MYEVSSTSSFPVQESESWPGSESSVRDLPPVRAEDRNKQRLRTKKRGADMQTDVRITKCIHLIIYIQMVHLR